MLDLIIKNGSVVDGTGSPARQADIGIRDGRIVAVGTIDEEAKEVHDAKGLTVSPGFIETHTHVDAQIIWDPAINPLSMHGVTTLVGGNCGLTLGPVRDTPEEKEWLMGLLASVEALPMEALREGIDFHWNTFEGFLNEIDRPVGVNSLFFVGHGALRRVAMGPDTARAATPEEVDTMVELLDAALAAGGLGFSTAGHSSHLDLQGAPTPPQFADHSEMMALAKVVSKHEGTCIQITPGSTPIGFNDEDRKLLRDLATTSERPVFWLTPLLNKQIPDLHERMLSVVDDCRAAGGQSYGIFLPSAGPFRQSFENPFFMRIWAGTWKHYMTLPFEERLAALKDPEVRESLRTTIAEDKTHFSFAFMGKWVDHEVIDVPTPEMQHYVGRNIGDLAKELGKDPFDVVLDIAVEGNLDVGFVSYDVSLESDPWMHEHKQQVLRDSRVSWGGSDAGAHVDAGVGADFPPRTIEQLVRRDNWFSLEEAIHHLTAENARKWGITDRGLIAEGKWADIIIFDPETLAPGKMERRTNWPAGAWWLATESVGLDTVIVNGVKTVDGGQHTGNLNGKVLRSGRDTHTATKG